MKKRVLKLVAMLLMEAVSLLSHAEGGTISYTATYDFSGLSIGSRMLAGVTYTTVKYKGLYNSGAPGTPSLPVDYIMFSVPYNAANFTVTAISDMPVSIPIDHMVYPCQESLSGIPVIPPDSEVYGINYPSCLAWVMSDGYLASENHVVTVGVMPISYNHSDNAGYDNDVLNKNGTIHLCLNYEIDPSIVDIPVRNGYDVREEGFQLVEGLVVNPDDVENFAFKKESFHDNKGEGSSDEKNGFVPGYLTYKYLIVTTPDLLRPMRRIAALKRQKGISVKVVTVDEAVNSPIAQPGDSIYYNGDVFYVYYDEAGKLRQYLRNSYDDYGTNYVLMAGSGVPDRYQQDMYFCDLNADWYVWNDSGSELYVGRLLGDSAKLFDNYADKLLQYELNPGNGDYSYLQRALLTESEVRESFSMSLDGILPTSSFISELTDQDYPSGCSILDSIGNNHYGFWGMFHQGTPSYYKVYGPDIYGEEHYLWAIDTVRMSPGTIIDNEIGNGLNMMSSKYYPMIGFSGYGLTMPYSIIAGYTTDLNIGESFTMGKDYGGPVYMGLNKNVTTLETLTFSGWFSNYVQSGYNLGQSYALTRFLMTNDDGRDSLLRYHNYLGDPELRMWTDIPQEYSSVTVSRSNNAISVSGIGVPYSIVAYYSNDGKTGSIKALGNNLVLNNISPNSTIMVYHPGYIPYIAPLLLQNTTIDHSQYVIATDVTAGKNVDSNRTQGNVTVEGGVEYEIEATGNVLLSSGFKVERGATFAVRKSSYK